MTTKEKVARHPLKVTFPNGDVLETYSSSSMGELRADVGIAEHPAWNDGMLGKVNTNVGKVAKFQRKFADL